MPKKYNKSPVKLVKRGNIYHITISTIVSGQRVFIRESSHSTDRNQALQYANQRLQDIIRQAEFQTSQLKEVTIDYAFGLFWEEVGKLHANAKDTLNKLKNLTSYFNTQQYISNLTVEDITAFIRAKDAENRKNATINRYLALLSAVFTRCKLHKINLPDINIRHFMRKEPAENVKYFADWETVNKIIDNAAPHIKPIILTAIYTGFRISAILKLKWTDIIGDEFIINVKDSKFEGGKIQRKPIFPVMKDLLDTLPHDSDYIFTYKGLPIKRINKGWNRALERAGLPHQTIHTLRHTHATWVYNSTGDLRLVKDSLGHSNIKTTLKYAHPFPNRIISVMDSVFAQNQHKQ